MKIIHEVQLNQTEALRLFNSSAAPRKNNLRIHYHTLIEISLILRGKGVYKTKNSVYYICIKRIEEALTQIKTTEKSILDIALDCGFNNTVNFNKIFKKYTNVAPSTFRR